MKHEVDNLMKRGAARRRGVLLLALLAAAVAHGRVFLGGSHRAGPQTSQRFDLVADGQRVRVTVADATPTEHRPGDIQPLTGQGTCFRQVGIVQIALPHPDGDGVTGLTVAGDGPGSAVQPSLSYPGARSIFSGSHSARGFSCLIQATADLPGDALATILQAAVSSGWEPVSPPAGHCRLLRKASRLLVLDVAAAGQGPGSVVSILERTGPAPEGV